jgi:hypothetical protein
LWNDSFNPGNRRKLSFAIHFIPNLFNVFGTEWYYWVTGEVNQSWFDDSPLSDKGKDQADGVQAFLKSNLSEILWLYMALYRSISLYIALRGSTRLYMALLGSTWLYLALLALLDSTRLYMPQLGST